MDWLVQMTDSEPDHIQLGYHEHMWRRKAASLPDDAVPGVPYDYWTRAQKLAREHRFEACA